jgi:transcriptional regulator with XRE-family HTH domain
MDQISQRAHFLQSFSKRLCSVLKEKGFFSNTASSGVKVTELSKAAGCSNQMARRYSLGEAMPDYDTVLNIAHWLDTSPGWLLFGNDDLNIPKNSNVELVGIDYELLRYILIQASPLISTSADFDETVNFIIDVVYDSAHISTDDKTRKKIIDMTISSAGRFQNNTTREKELPHGNRKKTKASI